MRSQKWHFRYPGMGLHCGDLSFHYPVTEREARKELRDRAGIDRLPNGTEFWV